MIKAICFDLDGVYFPENGKVGFDKALKELADAEKVEHALYKSDEMSKYVRGKISEVEFYEYLRGYLEIALSNSEIRELWVHAYVVDKDVKSIVVEARAQGYKTCICSNNNPGRVAALQERFGFLDDFDVHVFSYEVGDVKPSRKIFQELIDRSNVQPHELIYSDDNPERIQGAKELGINTFVYQGLLGFVGELKKLGVEIDVSPQNISGTLDH